MWHWIDMMVGHWRFLWCAALLIIIWVTTVPGNVFVGHSHWFIVKWIPLQGFRLSFEYLTDLAGNILLFVPLGYSQLHLESRLGRSGIPGAVVLGVILSLSVELFQVYSHGRAPSVTDVLCNGVGACIGALAARWESLTSIPPRQTHALGDSDSRTACKPDWAGDG
ncbi:MAG: VanZ family protein [Nitrospiraceae bacterium]